MPRGRPPYADILTPREWEVLRLIEEGLTNEEIAARLGISFSGARYHVAEIISKLEVSSRYEAAEWARERQAAKQPWAGLALFVSRLHLGSPASLAGAGIVVAGIVLMSLAVLLFRGSGGGESPEDEFAASSMPIDFVDAETFVQSLPPLHLLDPGQVLYTRREVYERHGSKGPQISAANGIPVERYVQEAWMEAGPNDALVRAYGRVTHPDGTPILAYHTEDGISRIYDVATGGLFRQDETGGETSVIGDPMHQVNRLLGALRTGELVPVALREDGLVLEARHDEAYYERVFFDSSRTGREWTEDQKAEIRKGFFQRNHMENDTFAIPFYGDLNAVEVVIRVHVSSAGLETRQEIVVRTEAGEFVTVGRTEADQAIVDAIPQEVIDLAR